MNITHLKAFNQCSANFEYEENSSACTWVECDNSGYIFNYYDHYFLILKLFQEQCINSSMSLLLISCYMSTENVRPTESALEYKIFEKNLSFSLVLNLETFH